MQEPWVGWGVYNSSTHTTKEEREKESFILRQLPFQKVIIQAQRKRRRKKEKNPGRW
jgi:hypothetical protein